MNDFILKSLLNDNDIDVYCLGETDSTNNFAAEKARAGEACIVTADRQTRGKGRRGRSFISEEGGLYLSLSTKLPGRPCEIMHYPILAALAVSNAIESVCAAKADIKWPNDILIKGKKVCGILTELTGENDECFLVTGIGVNITNKIPESLSDAGTLKGLTGTEPEREVLAAAISNQLISIYRKGIANRDELLENVSERCISIGKRVKALSTGVTGRAKGLGPDGSLIVELPGGATEHIIFGDVTIQKD